MPSLLSIFMIIAAFPLTVQAQSYSLIDGDLNLYCTDLPDGTNMVARVISNKGLHSVTPVDGKAEQAKLIKLRKNLEKRINTLNKIKKSYNPSSDGTKLKQIYKFVANEIVNDLDSDGSLDNTKPNQIFKKISAMISQLKHRLGDLQNAIETIDRCLKNEDLIPPPQAVSPEVIVFPFTHPDYKTTEWMRGLGVTAILPKKRSNGIICVAASKPHSALNTFPKESALYVTRNPCLMFWQRTFRNYPFCHYGPNEHSAVGWFSITDAAFSSKAVDDSERASLEIKLANYAPIHVRAPTKKNPCRTGK